MTEVVITINGRKFSVNTSPLSFRDMADFVGFHGLLPSMTMRVPGREGRIVHPGESVLPVEGMIVNVADTSNA